MDTNAHETSDAKQCGSGHLFRDGKPDQLPRREARGRGATGAARPIPSEQEERSAIGRNRQDRFLPSPFDTRSSSLHVLPSSLDTPAARGRVTRHQRREDLPCPSARHSTPRHSALRRPTTEDTEKGIIRRFRRLSQIHPSNHPIFQASAFKTHAERAEESKSGSWGFHAKRVFGSLFSAASALRQAQGTVSLSMADGSSRSAGNRRKWAEAENFELGKRSNSSAYSRLACCLSPRASKNSAMQRSA